MLALPTLLLLQSVTSHAQDGGARPVTLVVPFPAGSVTDNVTRAVAQQLILLAKCDGPGWPGVDGRFPGP